jgi:hypothetical protein
MVDYISIDKAQYVKDYTVKLFFNDGTDRDVDFGAFLLSHPHPQWDKYRDLRNFKKFKVVQGNIVWGKNWDLIFPEEQLYNGVIL